VFGRLSGAEGNRTP